MKEKLLEILKNKKLLIIIGSCIVALAIIIGVIFGIIGAVMNTPQNVVKSTIANVFTELQERQELKPVFKTLKEGSIEANYSSNNSYYGGSVEGKIYFNSNDKQIKLENVSIDLNGYDLSGSAYLSDKYIYVEENNHLGDVVGICKGEALSEFEDSIFASNSYSDYAIPEDVSNIISSLLDHYDNSSTKDFNDKTKSLIEKYYNIFFNSLEKNAEYSSETKKVKVGSDRIDARVITITLTQDDAISLLEELFDEISKDDELRTFVIDNALYFEDALNESGAYYGDIDDFYDDILESLENAIENLDRRNYDFEYIFELVTPTSSASLLKSELTITDNGRDYSVFAIDAGVKGLKGADKITVAFDNNYQEFTYEVTSNDADKYKASLVWNAYGEGRQLLSVNVNRRREKIELSFNNQYLTLSGAFYENGDTLSFEFDNICVGGDDTHASVNVSLKEKDGIPSHYRENEITPLSELVESDIDAIFTRTSRNISQDFADEINSAARYGDYYSIGEVQDALGEDAIEILIMSSGAIVAINGIDNLDDLEDEFDRGARPTGIVVTILNGKATSAKYGPIDPDDIF